jgi:unspecific monooxygenase
MYRLVQSPTDPAFVQNPYPAYARARAAGGALIWWEDYAMPCALSYAAVNAVLRDRRFGREIPAELSSPPPPHLAPFYAIEDHSMLELEPPRHTRLRGLVLRAFTSQRIADLAPGITALAQDLIDAFPQDAPFDLLPAYARMIFWLGRTRWSACIRPDGPARWKTRPPAPPPHLPPFSPITSTSAAAPLPMI